MAQGSLCGAVVAGSLGRPYGQEEPGSKSFSCLGVCKLSPYGTLIRRDGSTAFPLGGWSPKATLQSVRSRGRVLVSLGGLVQGVLWALWLCGELLDALKVRAEGIGTGGGRG